MICAKERADEDVSGGICRACADEVRRDAAGGKRREKRSAERALRVHGQKPKEPKTSR
jgi:hypothetical protein